MKDKKDRSWDKTQKRWRKNGAQWRVLFSSFVRAPQVNEEQNFKTLHLHELDSPPPLENTRTTFENASL